MTGRRIIFISGILITLYGILSLITGFSLRTSFEQFHILMIILPSLLTASGILAILYGITDKSVFFKITNYFGLKLCLLFIVFQASAYIVQIEFLEQIYLVFDSIFKTNIFDYISISILLLIVFIHFLLTGIEVKENDWDIDVVVRSFTRLVIILLAGLRYPDDFSQMINKEMTIVSFAVVISVFLIIFELFRVFHEDILKLLIFTVVCVFASIFYLVLMDWFGGILTRFVSSSIAVPIVIISISLICVRITSGNSIYGFYDIINQTDDYYYIPSSTSSSSRSSSSADCEIYVEKDEFGKKVYKFVTDKETMKKMKEKREIKAAQEREEERQRYNEWVRQENDRRRREEDQKRRGY